MQIPLLAAFDNYMPSIKLSFVVQKLLTQIQSSLAAKMSDVTAERIAELNTDIHVQCEDILERCIAVVQERESSNARGRLVTAVTEASRAFKVSTRNITNSSSSENEARRICQVGTSWHLSGCSTSRHTMIYSVFGMCQASLENYECYSLVPYTVCVYSMLCENNASPIYHIVRYTEQ